MFTPEEMTAQLTRIERERNKKNEDVLDEDFQGEDDLLRENPAKIAERDRQFATYVERPRRQVLSSDDSSRGNGAVICPALLRGLGPLASMKSAMRGADQSNAL